MFRVLKLLLLLGILAGIGLVGFAYVGPILGVDFAPEKSQIRVPVEIDVD